MAIVFQLCVILLALLIAYWWANQGFFSSLLHFVSVVCAGAVALAVWEPLVLGVLLKNWGTDNYAWGGALVIVFVVALLLFRVAYDRLAPNNVTLPQWADQAFGGLFGAGSAVITIGILMLGVGFTQSVNEILGLQFHTRENRGITNDHDGEESLWLPAHRWTVAFYEFLSDGAMRPDFTGRPLAAVYPDLDVQAFSLIRDSYNDGRAKITIVPDAVTIENVTQGPDRYYVDITVNDKGYDHAQQFVMSSAQIRLLAYADGRIGGNVSVGHPDRWKQQVKSDSGAFIEKRFQFDDTSHYITSIPGQTETTFQVEFPIGQNKFQIKPGYIPRFVQIKGVRFELPHPNTWGEIAGMGSAPLGAGDGAGRTDVDASAPMAAPGDIAKRSDIRPINNATINNLLGLDHENRFLVEGRQIFPPGGRGGNRDTRIKGVFATPGTQIVQVDVSRSSSASMYPARDGAGGAPVLVDSQGREYFAKGYIYTNPDEYEISITPSQKIRSVKSLPDLPTSDTHKLRLIYEITEGVTIVAFKIGEQTVARTNLRVTF